VKKICGGCGAEYELTEHKSMFRDKDSIECDICGAKLFSWNGGCIWSKKLIKENTNSKDNKNK